MAGQYCPVNSPSNADNDLLMNSFITINAVYDMDWRTGYLTRCEYVPIRSDAASVRHTVSQPILQSI